MDRFQRTGESSNAKVGDNFELIVLQFFKDIENIHLEKPFSLEVGIGLTKKVHKFDLGLHEPPTLVECKSHRWTETGNVPSAKLTVLNESMLYFIAAPTKYQKILVLLKSTYPTRKETLAEYYVRTFRHLIPQEVTILELDEVTQKVKKIH